MKKVEMQAQNSGRVNQKARTRSILLAGALQMIRQGQQPTVEEVAQATGISKRTAYRYFDSREHLLADAALEGLRPKLAEVLNPVEGGDVTDRVRSLALRLHEFSAEYEKELRTMQRAALDASLEPQASKRPSQVRGARRVEWVEEALKQVKGQIPKAAYTRLVSALCVCVGIDSFLILRDIRGLPHQDIRTVVLWMCQTLLDATLSENRPAR